MPNQSNVDIRTLSDEEKERLAAGKPTAIPTGPYKDRADLDQQHAKFAGAEVKRVLGFDHVPANGSSLSVRGGRSGIPNQDPQGQQDMLGRAELEYEVPPPPIAQGPEVESDWLTSGLAQGVGRAVSAVAEIPSVATDVMALGADHLADFEEADLTTKLDMATDAISPIARAKDAYRIVRQWVTDEPDEVEVPHFSAAVKKAGAKAKDKDDGALRGVAAYLRRSSKMWRELDSVKHVSDFGEYMSGEYAQQFEPEYVTKSKESLHTEMEAADNPLTVIAAIVTNPAAVADIIMSSATEMVVTGGTAGIAAKASTKYAKTITKEMVERGIAKDNKAAIAMLNKKRQMQVGKTVMVEEALSVSAGQRKEVYEAIVTAEQDSLESLEAYTTIRDGLLKEGRSEAYASDVARTKLAELLSSRGVAWSALATLVAGKITGIDKITGKLFTGTALAGTRKAAATKAGTAEAAQEFIQEGSEAAIADVFGGAPERGRVGADWGTVVKAMKQGTLGAVVGGVQGGGLAFLLTPNTQKAIAKGADQQRMENSRPNTRAPDAITIDPTLDGVANTVGRILEIDEKVSVLSKKVTDGTATEEEQDLLDTLLTQQGDLEGALADVGTVIGHNEKDVDPIELLENAREGVNAANRPMPKEKKEEKPAEEGKAAEAPAPEPTPETEPTPTPTPETETERRGENSDSLKTSRKQREMNLDGTGDKKTNLQTRMPTEEETAIDEEVKGDASRQRDLGLDNPNSFISRMKTKYNTLFGGTTQLDKDDHAEIDAILAEDDSIPYKEHVAKTWEFLWAPITNETRQLRALMRRISEVTGRGNPLNVRQTSKINMIDKMVAKNTVGTTAERKKSAAKQIMQKLHELAQKGVGHPAVAAFLQHGDNYPKFTNSKEEFTAYLREAAVLLDNAILNEKTKAKVNAFPAELVGELLQAGILGAPKGVSSPEVNGLVAKASRHVSNALTGLQNSSRSRKRAGEIVRALAADIDALDDNSIPPPTKKSEGTLVDTVDKVKKKAAKSSSDKKDKAAKQKKTVKEKTKPKPKPKPKTKTKEKPEAEQAPEPTGTAAPSKTPAQQKKEAAEQKKKADDAAHEQAAADFLAKSSEKSEGDENLSDSILNSDLGEEEDTYQVLSDAEVKMVKADMKRRVKDYNKNMAQYENAPHSLADALLTEFISKLPKGSQAAKVLETMRQFLSGQDVIISSIPTHNGGGATAPTSVDITAAVALVWHQTFSKAKHHGPSKALDADAVLLFKELQSMVPDRGNMLGVVRLDPTAAGIEMVYSLIHELGHAATLQAIYTDPTSREMVEVAFDEWQRVVGGEPQGFLTYSTTDSSEMMAEFMANRHVQERMKQMAPLKEIGDLMKADYTKHKSLYDQLVSIVVSTLRKLLPATTKPYTFFDQMTEVMSSVTAKNTLGRGEATSIEEVRSLYRQGETETDGATYDVDEMASWLGMTVEEGEKAGTLLRILMQNPDIVTAQEEARDAEEEEGYIAERTDELDMIDNGTEGEGFGPPSAGESYITREPLYQEMGRLHNELRAEFLSEFEQTEDADDILDTLDSGDHNISPEFERVIRTAIREQQFDYVSQEIDAILRAADATHDQFDPTVITPRMKQAMGRLVSKRSPPSAGESYLTRVPNNPSEGGAGPAARGKLQGWADAAGKVYRKVLETSDGLIEKFSDSMLGRNGKDLLRGMLDNARKRTRLATTYVHDNFGSVRHVRDLLMHESVSEAERSALSQLMLDASYQQIDPRIGWQDHTWLSDKQKKAKAPLYRKVRKEYSALKLPLKEAFKKLADYYKTANGQMHTALVKALVYTHGLTAPHTVLLERLKNVDSVEALDKVIASLPSHLHDKFYKKDGEPSAVFDAVAKMLLATNRQYNKQKHGIYVPSYRDGTHGFALHTERVHRVADKEAAAKLKQKLIASTGIQGGVPTVKIELDDSGNYVVTEREEGFQVFPSSDASLREVNRLEREGVGGGYTITKKLLSHNIQKDSVGTLTTEEVLNVIKKLSGTEAVDSPAVQEFYKMLPDSSMMTRHVKRQGQQGVNVDLVQGMAKYVESTGRYVAALETAPEQAALRKSINEVNREGTAEEFDRNDSIVMELTGRIDRNDSSGALLQLLSGLGFTNTLMSPSHPLINLHQPWMLTVPYLSGKYHNGQTQSGISSAFSYVSRAHGRVMGPAIRKIKAERGGYNALKGEETVFDDMFTEIKKNVGTGEGAQGINAMLDVLVETGSIEHTFTNELHEMASSPVTSLNQKKGVGRKVREGAGETAHRVLAMGRVVNQISEMVNRAVTAIAAYEMAIDSGATHEVAVKEAQVAIDQTQINYDMVNRPAWMVGSAGAKVISAMKMYPLGLYSMISTQVYRGFMREGRSPEDTAKAIRTLTGITLMSQLFTGVNGALLIEPVRLAAVVMNNALGVVGLGLDDEDDENVGNPDRLVHDMLTDLAGEQVADFVTYGVYNAILGIDFSSRAGMHRLLTNTSHEHGWEWWADTFGSSLIGPIVGSGYQNIKSYNRAVDSGQGRVEAVFKYMFPIKAVKDLTQGYERATEGLLSKSGQQILPPSNLNAASKMMGFSPHEEAMYWNDVIADWAQLDVAKAARRKAMADYVQDRLRGRDTTASKRAIQEYNRTIGRKRYSRKITLENRNEGVKRAKEAQKETRKNPAGLREGEEGIEGT